MSDTKSQDAPVLVLGATGYIGGRLVPQLLEQGIKVRAAARSAGKLRCRPYAADPNLEIATADVLDEESLKKACEGCRAAYYLVHSMNPGQKDFAKADERAAELTAKAAEAAGFSQIVYLGGLGDADADLSKHLRSRAHTGEVLASGKTPVTTLRAAMILGSGSASFEILRHLCDNLPVMTTPKWVRVKTQPVGVRDVLRYLIGVLGEERALGRTFDICGPDVVSYEDMFDIYCEEAGLRKRLLIPVPVLTPTLSSYWINLVTPIHASLARPLVDGLKNETVCREDSIKEIVPGEALGVRESVSRALQKIEQQKVETCWSDAGGYTPPEWLSCGDAPYAGGTVLECNYKVNLPCPPEKVWDVIRRLGGDTGWMWGDRLWDLRGFVDRLLGGVGTRRGRRDPVDIREGDALDFWRVLVVEENRRLMLLAEMKVPGEALLVFRIEPLPDGGSELSQIARFLPKGLLGKLYWYSLVPFHDILFKGMLKNIAKAVGCKDDVVPVQFKGSGQMCMLPNTPPLIPDAREGKTA